MEFRPCIDLHNGKVKQIIGGTLDDSENPIENFISKRSPAYFAELFKKDNLTGGHVIMLGKGNKKAALEALNAYPAGLQIGGGINLNNALFYIKNGASHIIVTSYVFKDGNINFDNLNNLVNLVGKKRLVLDLSCRKKNGEYYVVTNRWQKFTDFRLNGLSLKYIQKFCAELLVHGVDVEGKQCGVEDQLIKLLAKHIEIPVTYAGGISGFDDLEKIKTIGQDRINVTIGSALDIFGGNLSYNKVINWF